MVYVINSIKSLLFYNLEFQKFLKKIVTVNFEKNLKNDACQRKLFGKIIRGRLGNGRFEYRDLLENVKSELILGLVFYLPNRNAKTPE